MTWFHLRRAMLIVWFIISTLVFCILVSSFVSDANRLPGILPECAWKRFGKECVLCGMTRGFLSISKGFWKESFQMNGGALPLYLTFLSNELFFVVFLANLIIAKMTMRREDRECRR